MNPINEQWLKVLHDRLKNEYAAFLFYNNIYCWCLLKGHAKAAEYFRLESEQELSHAKMLQDFMVGWGCEVNLPQANTALSETIENLADCIYKSLEIESVLYQKYEENARASMEYDTSLYSLFIQFVDIQKYSIFELNNKKDKLKSIDINDTAAMLDFELECFQ